MSKEQIQFLTYTALLNNGGGGGGGDPSNWSSYPALTSVSMGGNSLNYNSNTSLSPTTLTINSNMTLGVGGLSFAQSNTTLSPSQLTIVSNTTLSSSGLNLLSNTSFTPTTLTVNSNTTLSSSGLNLLSNTSFTPTTLTINSNTSLTSSNLSFTGGQVLSKTSLFLGDSNGYVQMSNYNLSISNLVSATNPTINLYGNQGSALNMLKGTVDYGGEIYTTQFGIDSGETLIAGVRNPAGTPVIMPMNLVGQPIRMIMGGADTRQLLLSNVDDNTSGYLWVDSNGGLNWGSNLIASGPAPP